jgi:hypothetical protein
METPYMMLSVMLDEAVSLHNVGSLMSAMQSVSILSPLCGGLTGHLQELLRVLEQYVEYHALAPNVRPLSAANFLGQNSKYAAYKSSAVSSVLFPPQARFLNKIETLRKLVCALGVEFCDAAEELSCDGPTAEHLDLWRKLNTGHFDLNTCVRELMVMPKSFLRALPEDQLANFQHSMSHQAEARRTAKLSA